MNGAPDPSPIVEGSGKQFLAPDMNLSATEAHGKKLYSFHNNIINHPHLLNIRPVGGEIYQQYRRLDVLNLL